MHMHAYNFGLFAVSAIPNAGFSIMVGLLVPLCGFLGTKQNNSCLVASFTCCSFMSCCCGGVAFMTLLLFVLGAGAMVPKAEAWMSECDPYRCIEPWNHSAVREGGAHEVDCLAAGIWDDYRRRFHGEPALPQHCPKQWLECKGDHGGQEVGTWVPPAQSSWQCHHYDVGQDDAWCRLAGIQSGVEYKFVGYGIHLCQDCWCCKRDMTAGKALPRWRQPYHHSAVKWEDSRRLRGEASEDEEFDGRADARQLVAHPSLGVGAVRSGAVRAARPRQAVFGSQKGLHFSSAAPPQMPKNVLQDCEPQLENIDHFHVASKMVPELAPKIIVLFLLKAAFCFPPIIMGCLGFCWGKDMYAITQRRYGHPQIFPQQIMLQPALGTVVAAASPTDTTMEQPLMLHPPSSSAT